MAGRLDTISAVFMPYAALVLIHALLGSQMERPTVFADEAGYLGNARYLAGAAHLPDLQGNSFYHFGYSLLIVPAFWIYSDPLQSYTAVMFINALLISLLFFPIRYLLITLSDVPEGMSAVIAFVTCLYPSFLLLPRHATAETAFIPFFSLLIGLSLALLTRRSYWTAAAFGLVAGFLYTIHPRALPVIPISLGFLIILGWRKALPWSMVLASGGVIGLTYNLTNLVNAHLRAVGWGGAGVPSASRIVLRVVSPLGLKDFLLQASGQTLYLSQATYGLFLLGFMYICREIWKRGSSDWRLKLSDNDKIVPVQAFLLVTSCGLFFASCAALLHSTRRADLWIYGRYNEGFLAPYIAIGLARIFSERENRQVRWLVSALVLGIIEVLTLAVLLGRGREISTMRVNAGNVFGIFPLVRELGYVNLPITSLLAVFLFLTITWVSGKSFIAGLVLLTATFASVTSYNYSHLLVEAQKVSARVTTLASYIRTLGQVPSLSYDVSGFNARTYFSYQFLLPGIRFNRFASRRGETPQSPVVVSTLNWPDAERLDAQFIMVERNVDNALWVLPGEIYSEVARRLALRKVTGLRLGVDTILGVWETGFHAPEGRATGSVRWTNGAAKLVVPLDTEHSLKAVRFVLEALSPKGTELQLSINGRRLFHSRIPPGVWIKSFNLAGHQLGKRATIELLSDTFVPKELLGSPDVRTLGVVVHSIQFLEKDWLVSDATLPDSGYRSKLALPHHVQPLQMDSGGSIPVRVTLRNVSDSLWQPRFELGRDRGAVRVGILWFRHERPGRPVAEWRADLPWAMIPDDEHEIGVSLKATGYDGKPLPPGRYEVWIGLVQENIAWFYKKGDAVQKLSVEVYYPG